MQYLNWYYSNKKSPTNVLSFPFKSSLNIRSTLIGDIVICKQIIEYEAKKRNISLYEHWAHIVVHGSLHLLGYDHYYYTESIFMEQLEINIMKKLGYNLRTIF